MNRCFCYKTVIWSREYQAISFIEQHHLWKKGFLSRFVSFVEVFGFSGISKWIMIVGYKLNQIDTIMKGNELVRFDKISTFIMYRKNDERQSTDRGKSADLLSSKFGLICINKMYSYYFFWIIWFTRMFTRKRVGRNANLIKLAQEFKSINSIEFFEFWKWLSNVVCFSAKLQIKSSLNAGFQRQDSIIRWLFKKERVDANLIRNDLHPTINKCSQIRCTCSRVECTCRRNHNQINKISSVTWRRSRHDAINFFSLLRHCLSMPYIRASRLDFFNRHDILFSRQILLSFTSIRKTEWNQKNQEIQWESLMITNRFETFK